MLSMMFGRCLIAAMCLSICVAINDEPFKASGSSCNHSFAPLPTVNAPSSSEQWLIRGDSTYKLVTNTSTLKEWSIQSVNEELRSQQSAEQYQAEQAAVDRWMKRLEASYKYQPTVNQSLTDWYLRHVQCRACVANNHQLIDPSINEHVGDVTQAAYAPLRIMKWCSNTFTRRSDQTEVIDRPLMDYEGHCIEATAACPSDSVDLNIIDQSTCKGDDAATKLTCPLCVLDDHVWRTKKSIATIDGYEGECWSRAQLAFTDFMFDPDQLFIDRLDQCASPFSNTQ